MPIYAYQCSSCAHQQDFLQKISDPLLTICPACSQATLQKQVTAAGFQLKGSGWYVTDFKNNGAQTATASKESSHQESNAAKTDAKTNDSSSNHAADSGAKSATTTSAETPKSTLKSDQATSSTTPSHINNPAKS